jgi:8-oxo-dGTP pyrophosphatase MutT (NUDIX family)
MFLHENGLQDLKPEGVNIDPEYIKSAIESGDHPVKPSNNSFRAASVFMLLGSDNPMEIIAIQKADTEGYPWRNQVAFPGGHVDKTDADQRSAAYRELKEELNICSENVEYIGSLGHFMTINNVLIEAFVGVWNGKDRIDFDEGEISRVMRIPLKKIAETHMAKGFSGRTPDWTELIYPYADVEVWGVTAKIIHHFLEVLIPETQNIADEQN